MQGLLQGKPYPLMGAIIWLDILRYENGHCEDVKVQKLGSKIDKIESIKGR